MCATCNYKNQISAFLSRPVINIYWFWCFPLQCDVFVVTSFLTIILLLASISGHMRCQNLKKKKTSPENLEMSLYWVFERTTQRKNYFWSDRSINDNLLCWCLNLRNWLSQPETFAKHFLKQSYKGFLNRACATLFINTFCCKSKRSAFMSQLFEKLFFAEHDHPIWSNRWSRWCLWKW